MPLHRLAFPFYSSFPSRSPPTQSSSSPKPKLDLSGHGVMNGEPSCFTSTTRSDDIRQTTADRRPATTSSLQQVDGDLDISVSSLNFFVLPSPSCVDTPDRPILILFM
ncbi:hypothetical protein M6B38_103000 [Iris pallida]|uniref:Uncharacterized protein n=1 Tax=Iris pallida TaxID=29817 RepID=A0AAX6G7T0_IRIPA|nr:hypothetical protein M6B38_103000 [Iris pallida]